ncbi:MAG: hypothetical protein AABO41_06315 [Acidobacteriota bacterium]
MVRAKCNEQNDLGSQPSVPASLVLRNARRRSSQRCLRSQVLGIVAVLGFIIGVLDSTADGQEKAGAQEANVGVVRVLSGDWFLVGRSGLIQRGQALPAGGKIALVSKGQKTRGSYIEIYMLNGLLMSIYCDKLGICDRPISLPETIQSPPSLSARFWGVLKSLVSRSERLASTLSRGDELQDAIVKLADGQVDLGLVFKKMKPGRYLLSFQSIAPSRAASEPALAQVSFNWEPGRSLPVYAPSLRPSLFQIDLLEASTEKHEPSGTDAWVLLVRSADYEKSLAAFQNVEALTRTWGEASKAESARTFLRAYLEYLATQELR